MWSGFYYEKAHSKILNILNNAWMDRYKKYFWEQKIFYMINLTDYINCFDFILDQQTRTNIINNIKFNDFEIARIDDDTTGSRYRNCYQNRLNHDFDKKIYEGLGKVLRKYAQTFQHFGTALTTEDTGSIHLIVQWI